MRMRRKTVPRVVGGKVRPKHRDRQEADYRASHQVRIERVKAGPGYRHFVSPTDVAAFLALLPGWRELAVGLQRVLLDHNPTCQGWHSPGTVALCTWPEKAACLFSTKFHDDHAATLKRLRVPCRRVLVVNWRDCWEHDLAAMGKVIDAYDPRPIEELNLGVREVEDHYEFFAESLGGEGRGGRPFRGAPGYVAEFTEATARAFLLVHVLVHELGHHHDRMTSPRQRRATRGEAYAEAYALRHEARIWSEYCRVFQPR